MGHIAACLLIAFGVLSRVAPHPPNFTAVAAVAMFASFYLGSWKMGAAVPLVTLVLSDLVKGAYEPRLMAVVYASSLIPVVFGIMLRNHFKARWVVGGALASSVTFYLTTNFAVWQFSDWYSRDWSGLATCYAAALPFFRYTLMSDLMFSSCLFGLYVITLHYRAIVPLVFGSRLAITVPVHSSGPCS
jgi:hypothetical protein